MPCAAWFDGDGGVCCRPPRRPLCFGPTCTWQHPPLPCRASPPQGGRSARGRPLVRPETLFIRGRCNDAMSCRPLSLHLHQSHHPLHCAEVSAISPREGEMSAEPTEGGELALTAAGKTTPTLRLPSTIFINQNLQKSHAKPPVGISPPGMVAVSDRAPEATC